MTPLPFPVPPVPLIPDICPLLFQSWGSSEVAASWKEPYGGFMQQWDVTTTSLCVTLLHNSVLDPFRKYQCMNVGLLRYYKSPFHTGVLKPSQVCL